MSFPRLPLLAAPVAGLALALVPPLAAQTAPAPGDAAGDTTVELSPFEVNTTQDHGYAATNTLAGGRTSMPLEYAPAAISVMTRQFLDDIAATDFQGVEAWTVNYTPDLGVNTSGIGGIQNNFRNMGATFASRNYFLWYMDSDSFDVDRYEFARGPNGVLFGDGGAAGIATTFTKQAHLANTFGEGVLRINSYGGIRFTADVNEPIGDRAAIRVNVLDQHGRFDYRQHTHWNRSGVDVATLVKVTKNDNLRIEAELGQWSRSIFPETINDQGSLWNQTSSYDGKTAIANATAAGVQVIPAASGLIYSGGALANWTNFYRSIGVGNVVNLSPTGAINPVLLHPAALPFKGFNFEPPDIVGNTRYYTYTAYWDHKFSDNLNLEVAYNRQDQHRDANGNSSNNFFNLYQVDVNRVLPGGPTNPNYAQPYTDSQPLKQINANMVDDVRALANYQFKSSWLDESVCVIAGSRMDRFHGFQSVLRQLSNNANVFVRQYWNEQGDPEGNLDLPGTDYVTTVQNWQRKAIDYGQVATVSQFFHDRLTFLLGARHDSVYNSQLTISVPKTVTRVSTTSRNAGVVYYFVPWLGAFANYSETFQPPNTGNPLLNGTPPGISRAKGQDYGFNLRLFDGKITGSVRYYEAEQDGVLQAGNNVTEVNNIWLALNQPQNEINPYRDTSDTKGRGYEVELIGNPTDRLRFTFNIAFPKSTVVNVEPQLRAYVAANLATWQPAAATNPTVQTNLSTITTRLGGLVTGATNPQTYEYTANLLGAYAFRQGLLRHLTLGGGANFRGDNVIGNYPGQPYNYVTARAYALAMAFATYTVPLSRSTELTFQANVTNLFNNHRLIPYAVANITTAGNLAPGYGPLVYANVRIPDPRQLTLTATLKF